jgi:hypothetical protein
MGSDSIDVTRFTFGLTRAVRAFPVVVALSSAPRVTATAQSIGPVSFRDSLVMRQIAFRAPCRLPVPRAWSQVDSTLGRDPRCSLIEVAARAISQVVQSRQPEPGSADPWNPLCVRVLVATNTGTTGLPGDWQVLFDLSPDRPAFVVIDRQTGDVGLTLVGSNQVGNRPRCLTG